jgi:CubicO group peptidase (beta-lactamase class C family)
MKQSDHTPATNQKQAATDTTAQGVVPSKSAKNNFSEIVNTSLKDVQQLQSNGRWDEIVNRVVRIRAHGDFQTLRPIEKVRVLYEGAIAADKLGHAQQVRGWYEEADGYIKAEEPAFIARQKRELQRFGGIATQKLQFSPETVLNSSVAQAPGTFQWTKAINVPKSISNLTAEIVEEFRSSRADSGVVIYRNQVVPFHENGVEKTVFYAPCCPERVMMMSSTKSIAGIAAVMMQQDGWLKLDQKVSQIMPEWGWDKDERKDITLLHLLTHTSGLPGNEHFQNPNFEAQFFGRWDNLTAGALMHRRVEPIGKHVYSNVGAQLLSPILTKILQTNSPGERLPDYLKRKLFDPLGMSNSQITCDSVHTPKLFADMLSTSLDFARVGVMVKDKGMWNGKQIMAAEAVDLMLRPPARLRDAVAHGCGLLWWNRRPGGLFLTLGYLDTSMIISRDHDLVVVRTQELPPQSDAGERLIKLIQNF